MGGRRARLPVSGKPITPRSSWRSNRVPCAALRSHREPLRPYLCHARRIRGGCLAAEAAGARGGTLMQINLGWLTLAALALAITLSCFTQLNVGLLAIALAWIIGVYLGGFPLRDITGGFPVDLFLTLTGVTLLFSQAQVNGTLERVAHEALRLCRGRVGLVPIMYFFLGAGLASAGPGNVATTGLLAPVAMATATRMQIPVFLMAIMVANGCNSGSLSPLAPTGIIVSGLMSNIGLPGLEMRAWFYNFLGHAIVAFAGYFIFGGWKLLTRSDRVEAEVKAEMPLTRDHWITLSVIALIIAGVVIAGFNIGMAAF